MKISVAASISQLLIAIENCKKSCNTEWEMKHGERLADLLKTLPSGAGIDTGTKLEESKTTPDKLVLSCSFHHMNGGGMYDGWTDHQIIVTPMFQGIDVRVTGRDRNQIKEYLGEVYHNALSQEVED